MFDFISLAFEYKDVFSGEDTAEPATIKMLDYAILGADTGCLALDGINLVAGK